MKSDSLSEQLYARALRTIPWGTQTNAKRPQPAMAGAMPLFIERAKGSRMWDVEGREFVDFRAALGPIILGYCDPRVDEAAKRQIDKGVQFSMASPIEMEVAEAIRGIMPWAEKVRFLKTGADAASAALRIARAYTGRNKFISCGYHGWHDSFAASDPGHNRGVPLGLRDYVYPIAYGDYQAAQKALSEDGADIAAILTLPYDLGPDTSGTFLRKLREMATANGSLLIFDEIITGFRLANGGGGEYFGVAPDLVVLGKAMANGYPLTAFAGKSEYMSVLDESGVFISTTYAGEAVSLAACQATLAILASEPVMKHIWEMGHRLMTGLVEAGKLAGVPLRSYGLAPCSNLTFDIDNAQEAAVLRDGFYRGLFLKGVFPNSPWFITYAHTASDIDETIEKATTALREARDTPIS